MTQALTARLERQLTQVKTCVLKLNLLESQFEQTQELILSNAALSMNFQREIDVCLSEFGQIEDLTQNPALQEITSLAMSKLEQLNTKFISLIVPIPVMPIDTKAALLHIAEQFKSHRTCDEMQNFVAFEREFPQLAGQIYRNLWRLKGSPTNLHSDFGHRAFHHLDGFCSQNNEKSEAILLIYSSVENRLRECKELFSTDQSSEATAKFKEFETIYPMIAATTH